MVKTASTMLPLGTKAPDFSLPNVDGRTVSLADFADAPALLVVFMCNHCPFVIHVSQQLAKLAREYQAQGVAVVGINSNDVANYPDDAPPRMAAEVEERLHVPLSLRRDAARGAGLRRGLHARFLCLRSPAQTGLSRADGLEPARFRHSGNGPGPSRRLDAVLAGRSVPEKQKPSIGCNIKWKTGNEPSYFSH